MTFRVQQEDIGETLIREILSRYEREVGKMTILSVPLKVGIIRKIVSELFNISIEVKEVRERNFSAYLLPRTGGFTIITDTTGKDVYRGRRRVSIIHELIHTFFFDYSGQFPKKLPNQPAEPKIFEYTRKLLIPDKILHEYLEYLECLDAWVEDYPICSLRFLSQKFYVGLEVVAYRLALDGFINNIMYTFWDYLKNSETGNRVKIEDLSDHAQFEKNFNKRSMLSPSLGKLITKYWRNRYIYPELWIKGVRNCLITKRNERCSLTVSGKKKFKLGISCFAECEPIKRYVHSSGHKNRRTELFSVMTATVFRLQ